MKRDAFILKLKPGNVAEYKRRHDEIWPELVEEIRKSGVQDFSIFLDEESLTLFAYQKIKEGTISDEKPISDVSRRWRDYMADILEVNPDNSAKCRFLREVFHLD